MAKLPHCVYFDSAQHVDKFGRYSYIAAEPFDWFEILADGSDGLASLAKAMALFASETIAKLPPFQGGAAGLLGYELARSLEKLPSARFDEFQAPALAVGLYDIVVAFDHHEGRCWVVSQGFPETSTNARRRQAEGRLAEMLERLDAPLRNAVVPGRHERVPTSALAPQFPVAENEKLSSDFSRDGYLDAVARAVEYIHAGDVFQVNLSQRLLTPSNRSPVETYLALRQRNPAPFAGYFDLGVAHIASASPERFLSVRGSKVETRPIKGTRERASDPREDRRIADKLLAHPKDRAENVMIVDLLRNDLSRVCTPESVDVTQLCQLETYRHVHHLVSVVTGKLRRGLGPIDLLRASFPGGSITGAPKVRAMEIIAELEPTARGPYCGSLAWLGFNGDLDSSILIRTLVQQGGWIRASVGGGIVADSDPEAEYAETWHKARGLFGD